MTKKVGGMQPYLFPYLGYFQLIAAVDVFVLAEDLQYIKSGWINRNRILMYGEDRLITFPLKKASYSLKINERLLQENFAVEAEKILKMIRIAYSKAPFFGEVMPLLEEIIRYPETNLAKYAENSIRRICHYLSIETPIVLGSELGVHDVADKTDRVLQVVRNLGGDMFINPIGGMQLYDPDFFRKHGVELRFHKMDEITYRQFKNDFLPRLSIIDVLMFNAVPEVQTMLSRYSLLQTPGDPPPLGGELQELAGRSDDTLLVSVA